MNVAANRSSPRGRLPFCAAAGAALGSWLLAPVPLLLIAALAAAFVWRPRAWIAFALFAAAACWLGERALHGLADAPSGPVDAWVTLLDDPRPLGVRGVRVTVRLDGARVEARAYSAAAARLSDSLSGERLHITGNAAVASGDWHRWRHVASTLGVDAVGDRAAAAPLSAFANSVRRLLENGSRSLSDDSRAMFAGMVYGDDRNQSPRLSDDFRAAGLGHLLVVSGQNVAFVLALASPLVTRLRPGVRLVALLALLGVFAVLTRLEPSVLRAVSMAAVAVGSTALGRPESGRRALAWAVAGILLVDPFLVRVLAFQLSVCATAGLLWITPALSEALRGPRPLRLAIATTAGAQIAVTPLLVTTFGSVPVASLPANVIAGPASAPVMMWGLTGGLVAGMLEGWPAWLLHRPSAVLLWWIRSVAAAAAQAPPAMISSSGALVLCVGVALVLSARSPRLRRAGRGVNVHDHEGAGPSGVAEAAVRDGRATGPAEDPTRVEAARSGSGGAFSGRSRLLGAVGAALVVAVLAHAWVYAASPSQGWSDPAGQRLFRDGDSFILVLDGSPQPERLLEALRVAGVRRLALVVATKGGASDARASLALADRYEEVRIVAPPMHRVPRARTVRTGSVIDVGDVALTVVEDSPELVVEVTAEARRR